jgi:stearoyl-CoA desaturase (delta-9 desaturase)
MTYLVNGLLNAPWWVMVLYTLIMTHITMVGVTVYLHRAQAHRALELHPIIAHFFRFWLWFTTGMKTKEWVAVHRKHHAFSDKVGDPHSPVVEGISKVMWEGAELYRAAKKDPETLEKYGKGTPADWLERDVYSAQFMRGKQGVAALLILNVLLFGPAGIIIWGVQMAWTPFFAAGVINGLGHFIGYRNFECADAAVNMLPWGILIAGEELHNNHHAYGTSAKLSVKWWEFDIGWMYIRSFELLGLAKVKRLLPKEMTVPFKDEVDLDTVKALFGNRLQVLAQYSKNVIAPVFRAEKALSTCSTLCRRSRKAMIRHQDLLKVKDQEKLTQVLAKNARLQTVYHYRQQLQNMWNRTTATHKELLDGLKEWCQGAEQSGIESLQQFVHYVKAYQLQKA